MYYQKAHSLTFTNSSIAQSQTNTTFVSERFQVPKKSIIVSGMDSFFFLLNVDCEADKSKTIYNITTHTVMLWPLLIL